MNCLFCSIQYIWHMLLIIYRVYLRFNLIHRLLSAFFHFFGSPCCHPSRRRHAFDNIKEAVCDSTHIHAIVGISWKRLQPSDLPWCPGCLNLVDGRLMEALIPCPMDRLSLPLRMEGPHTQMVLSVHLLFHSSGRRMKLLHPQVQPLLEPQRIGQRFQWQH